MKLMDGKTYLIDHSKLIPSSQNKKFTILYIGKHVCFLEEERRYFCYQLTFISSITLIGKGFYTYTGNLR
jgi:hypothetical protein